MIVKYYITNRTSLLLWHGNERFVVLMVILHGYIFDLHTYIYKPNAICVYDLLFKLNKV